MSVSSAKRKSPPPPAAAKVVPLYESTQTPDDRLENIPIERIIRSGKNPRKHFDQAKLEELAESIKQVGLIQPVVVRPPIDGDYELVAGERRHRGCELAGLKLVPCIVRAASDSQTRIVRILENFDRVDLNSIEKALAFRELTEEGMTQTELAEKLHCTQGAIANHIRLLQLPEAWQERIISQVITETQGRELVPWASYPTVLKSLAETLKQRSVPFSGEGFKAALYHAVGANSRDLARWDVAFKPNPEQLVELDVREISSPHHDRSKERRAMNVALFDRLQRKAIDARELRQKKSAAKASENDVSAEQAKKKKQQQADSYHRKLYQWYIAWLQELLCGAIEQTDNDALVMRCLMYFAIAGYLSRRKEEFGDALKDCGGKAAGGGFDAWKALNSVPAEELPNVARKALKHWLGHECGGYQTDLDPRDVQEMAFAAGIVVKREWTLSADYLGLHSKDQLAEIALHDLGLTLWSSEELCAKKRGDLIDTILQEGNQKKVPREIADIKYIQLR